MKLVETSSFTMRPELDGAVSTKLTFDSGKKETELSFMDKQERIVNEFGGKKSKEVLRRRKQFQVN